MKSLWHWSLVVLLILVGLMIVTVILPFVVLCDLLWYSGGKPRS